MIIMVNNDTIVAVSTGSSSGAISIVRISGEKSIEIIRKKLINQKTWF